MATTHEQVLRNRRKRRRNFQGSCKSRYVEDRQRVSSSRVLSDWTSQFNLLSRAGQLLPLLQKTFELLLLLIQSPGLAFSKRELMSALWADTYVEEANLSFQISVLRKALGGRCRVHFETIPKHGYRVQRSAGAIVLLQQASLAEPLGSAKNRPSARGLQRGKEKARLVGHEPLPRPYSRAPPPREWWREPGPTRLELHPPSPFRSLPFRATNGRRAEKKRKRVAFSWDARKRRDNYDI